MPTQEQYIIGAALFILQLKEMLCAAQGTAQHSAALQRHEQRLRDIHAAFEAAVAAEWSEVQKTGKRQAAFLKVPISSAHFLCPFALYSGSPRKAPLLIVLLQLWLSCQ